MTANSPQRRNTETAFIVLLGDIKVSDKRPSRQTVIISPELFLLSTPKMGLGVYPGVIQEF